MRNRAASGVCYWVASLGLASCGQSPVEQQQQEVPSAPAASPAQSAAQSYSPGARKSGPARSGKQYVDPKSAEAATQIVHEYVSLIEKGQWTKSRTYWSDSSGAKQFERSFTDDADVHANMGHLGVVEGAAGSSYVTEPVTFYGKTNSGSDYRRTGQVVLRRVNHVPGSTAEQRRWHIERIDWKGNA